MVSRSNLSKRKGEGMKDFIKRTLYFDLFYNIMIQYCDGLILFKHGQVFKFTFDIWNIIFFIGGFVYGLLAVGIIKFISSKTDRFVYDSNKLICYAAVLYQGLVWFEISFFNFLEYSYLQIPIFLITVVYFIILVFVLYYFWRYRIEIAAGIILNATIYEQTDWSVWFYKLLHIPKPSHFLQGLFYLGVLVIFLAITISLRRMKVYDFRSRKDKWLEAMGEGPYKRKSEAKNC
jgi:hypothetical protein